LKQQNSKILIKIKNILIQAEVYLIFIFLKEKRINYGKI